MGSLLFKPPNVDDINDKSVIKIATLWSTSLQHCEAPTLLVTKTVSIFYDILNTTILDNSNNSYNISFLELLQEYRNANLEYLSTIIGATEGVNFLFSTVLYQVQETALAILNETTPQYYITETEGVWITTEEYQTFYNYIQSFYRTLEGIVQSVNIWDEFENFKLGVEKYQVAYDILYNPDRLREFINQQSRAHNISALDVEASLTINPNLKQHIQQYVSQYGWPDNFIFDGSKMAEILINLGIV